MPLNPAQEQELQSALRTTRILAFAICYLPIALYAAVFTMTVLQGQWRLFLQGFKPIPWQHPILLAFVAISFVMLVSALVVPNVLLNLQQNAQPGLASLRTKSIITFALLESIGIMGLVLGFILGPAVASLTLILLAVPPLACTLVFPKEPAWRTYLERNHPGGGHA